MEEKIKTLYTLLEHKGYDLTHVKYVSIGTTGHYDVTTSAHRGLKCIPSVEINVFGHKMWMKMRKETFEGFEMCHFRITCSGEKTTRPPGENVLCKMSKEKRKEVLNKYKK